MLIINQRRATLSPVRIFQRPLVYLSLCQTLNIFMYYNCLLAKIPKSCIYFHFKVMLEKILTGKQNRFDQLTRWSMQTNHGDEIWNWKGKNMYTYIVIIFQIYLLDVLVLYFCNRLKVIIKSPRNFVCYKISEQWIVISMQN